MEEVAAEVPRMANKCGARGQAVPQEQPGDKANIVSAGQVGEAKRKPFPE